MTRNPFRALKRLLAERRNLARRETKASQPNDQRSAGGSQRQWIPPRKSDFWTQSSHLPALRAPVCHADAPRAAYGNDAQAAAGGVALPRGP